MNTPSPGRANLNPLGWINPSLLKQLMLPVVSLWVACALLATSAAYLLAGRSTNTSFDRLLADDAQALSAQLRWNDGVASFAASKETADSLVFDSLSLSHYSVHTATGRTLMGDMHLEIPEIEARTDPQAIFFDHTGRRSHTPLRVVAQRFQPSPGDEAVWVVVAESKEKRRQVKDEIATAIFLPALIVGFFIIPLFYYSIRRALSPTRQLSALVVAHGDDNLSPLPVEQVPQELRELVAHTNSLLQRLQASVSEQRRFIADAAHQLQTPMAGIRLLVGDMRRIQKSDPTQPMDAEVLAQLDEVATRGARMVKQLLAFARVAEDSAAEPEVFEAVEAMLEPAARWRSLALTAGKSLELENHTDPKREFMLHGSPVLLGEVISNLLDNAIRYGGPQIKLRLHHHDSTLIVHVQDDGPPLDEHARSHLMLPFWRGDHGQPEGSGLGLSIAQRIVERLGGRFALVERAGLGACFEITLPCEVRERPAVQARNTEHG
ncbi:sensor histidine kinase [Comamonas sp.]|uniref:sensor histidine kinase n=1 Tax=Comamonas sp. TaxID=34028 RepID=UPI0012CD4588|nr:sensor histidine kinase [Comamonas sp.]MPS94217.1 sensor histidine kinase [Comamonas sp.]